MTRVKPYDPEINYWLLQTEPDQYSWDDLERESSTVWNGVTDYEALKNLRDIDDVDLAFICHKGDEPTIVGIVRVTSDSYPDPEGNDPTLFAIDVELVGRLPKPIRLNDIIDDPELQDFQFVQEPDLDVVEVPAPVWERLVEMAGAQDVGLDVGLIPTGRERA